MKLEEQKLILVDGKNVFAVCTDIETGEERYEVQGQNIVNVRTPQGNVQAPVHFQFAIEAENIQQAAEQLGERLREETHR